MKIDLGCGYCKRVGFVGVDKITDGEADFVCDIELGLPFADGEVDCFYGNHIWEHLRNPVFVFGEIHRCLKVGGVCQLNLPHPSDYNSMWGHFDHRRCFPVDWFLLQARLNNMTVERYWMGFYRWDDYRGLKGWIARVLDYLVNDLLGYRLWERLNWFTMKEMMLWMRKN